MPRVRPARPDDVEAIGTVHAAAIEARGPTAYEDDEVEAWASVGPDEGIDGEDVLEDYWVVAERDGAVVGFGRLDHEASEIVAVYVHPDHAREGVGSALVAGLEGYARGVGCSELGLSASKNAVEFYERLGYERVRAVRHEPTEGVTLDCVEMGKSL